MSYIYKALARRQRDGIATALSRVGRPRRKLDGHLEALVAHVAAHPDATLAELVTWSERERGGEGLHRHHVGDLGRPRPVAQ